jgi:periplasmic divalent cation tolerance protein
MREIVLALTTLPENFDARELARALVELRVAACVTIVPAVRSVYRWRDDVEDAAEQQLVIKTTADQLDALWAALGPRHPYDVPEFVILPVREGSPDYLRWIGESVRLPERLA